MASFKKIAIFKKKLLSANHLQKSTISWDHTLNIDVGDVLLLMIHEKKKMPSKTAIAIYLDLRKFRLLYYLLF